MQSSHFLFQSQCVPLLLPSLLWYRANLAQIPVSTWRCSLRQFNAKALLYSIYCASNAVPQSFQWSLQVLLHFIRSSLYLYEADRSQRFVDCQQQFCVRMPLLTHSSSTACTKLWQLSDIRYEIYRFSSHECLGWNLLHASQRAVKRKAHASRRGAGTSGLMKAGMLGTPKRSRSTAPPTSRYGDNRKPSPIRMTALVSVVWWVMTACQTTS